MVAFCLMRSQAPAAYIHHMQTAGKPAEKLRNASCLLVRSDMTYTCPQTRIKPDFFDRGIPCGTVSANGMALSLDWT